MNWIIQENLYNEEGFSALTRALDVMGLPYSVHKVVPFSHELLPDVSPENPTIVVGAYTMIQIEKDRGWVPGAYVNENFEFGIQHAHWGRLMLNSDAWIGRLDEVPEQKETFFLRPTFDSKVFSGEVMDWPSFAEWRDRVMALGWESTVRADTQVMAARQKTILREYRTWIVDREVVTASLYREGSRVRYDALVEKKVLEFAASCAVAWSPSAAFVLDVAETPEGLFILEINCLNAAGFYSGNVGKIVMALEDLESRRAM